MARPEEYGLKYFSFNVDFFNDEKIEAISGEFGIKGEITIIKLLCAIYRNGYFIEWTEMLKMKLLKNLPGVSSDLLDQIIIRLVKWGFFDKNLFDSANILTSHGIQKRYFEAVKRRKQNGEYPYLIVNVDIKHGSGDINVDINRQRKVKERKVKKINIESKDSLDEFSFEHAWKLYEKKGTSKVARRRWDNLTKAKKQLALRHIPLYVAATPVKQYRKNFETYLNQEAWNDEVLIPTDSGDENLGVGVWVENGKKYYGERSSPIEIPMNAPFRPGKQYAYDREKNNWTVL